MKTSRLPIARVIADTTLRDGISDEFSNEIAAYLLSEGRVNELESVLRDVQADWAQAGKLEVLARSAHPLEDAMIDQIRSQINKLYPDVKEIVITEIHDPSIVGGVKLNLPNQQLDLSVESKLNIFKQVATAGKD